MQPPANAGAVGRENAASPSNSTKVFIFLTPCLRLITDEVALQITEIDSLKFMQLLDDELMTAGGIMPATRIDGNAVIDGMPGSVTQRLTALY